MQLIINCQQKFFSDLMNNPVFTISQDISADVQPAADQGGHGRQRGSLPRRPRCDQRCVLLALSIHLLHRN